MNLESHPAGYRQVTLLLFDQRIFVAPYPPCSELFKTLAFPPDPQFSPATTEENYYQLYFALAAVFRPRSYLEIGTMFGYSTVAVSRGAPDLRRIVSCDLQTYENPHSLSSQLIAERNLRSSGFTGGTKFIVEDSRRLKEHVAEETFDLILVDGDHSYEGCRSDILTCYELLSPGGVIMIDDLDIPPVFSAVMDCMQELKIDTGDRCFVPAKHGLYLARHSQ
jgi:predicted O-methyltransferase YrrM